MATDGRIAYVETGIWAAIPGVWAVPPGIWTMKGDGSDAKPFLTAPDVRWYLTPRWSPDGTSLAFVDYSPANGYRLLRADVDAAHSAFNQVVLAGNGDNRAPSWHPDGSHLVFISERDPTAIWRVNPDGSGEGKLVAGLGASMAYAEYSPDGTEIAGVIRQVSGEPGDLFIGSTLANVQQLTAGQEVWEPRWSPDGARILFSHLKNVAAPNATFVTYLLQLDTGIVEQISPLPVCFPCWAPSGTKGAAYASQAGDPTTIWTASFVAPKTITAPKPIRKLSSSPTPIAALDWQSLA